MAGGRRCTAEVEPTQNRSRQAAPPGFSRRCGLRCPSSPAMSRRLCRRRRLPAQGDCHAGRVHAGGGYRQGHRLCVDHAGLLHCGRRQDRHGAEHLRPLVCRLHAPPSLRWWCCHFRYRRGEPERDPEPVPHGFGRRGAGGNSPPGKINLKPPSPSGKGVGGLSFPEGEGGQTSSYGRRSSRRRREQRQRKPSGAGSSLPPPRKPFIHKGNSGIRSAASAVFCKKVP